MEFSKFLLKAMLFLKVAKCKISKRKSKILSKFIFLHHPKEQSINVSAIIKIRMSENQSDGILMEKFPKNY